MADRDSFVYKLPYTLQQWLAEKQSNPNVLARVRVAEAFLRRKFPWYDDPRLLSELVCHDYSLPVEVAPIAQGTQLCGYKNPGADPVGGSYFAPAGTPLHRVGVGWEGLVNGASVPKVYHRYVVEQFIPEALKTRCAPARDMWSDNSRAWGQLQGGGATQYVIPDAKKHLRLVTR
jgi:hypothetical protein